MPTFVWGLTETPAQHWNLRAVCFVSSPGTLPAHAAKAWGYPLFQHNFHGIAMAQGLRHTAEFNCPFIQKKTEDRPNPQARCRRCCGLPRVNLKVPSAAGAVAMVATLPRCQTPSVSSLLTGSSLTGVVSADVASSLELLLK